MLTGGPRVIVRPSGTEPKLKLYLDVRGDSPDDARLRLARLVAAAREMLAGLGIIGEVTEMAMAADGWSATSSDHRAAHHHAGHHH